MNEFSTKSQEKKTYPENIRFTFDHLENNELLFTRPSGGKTKKKAKFFLIFGLISRFLLYCGLSFMLFLFVLPEANANLINFQSFSQTKQVGALLFPICSTLLLIGLYIRYFRQKWFSDKNIPLWDSIRFSIDKISVEVEDDQEIHDIYPSEIKQVVLKHKKTQG